MKLSIVTAAFNAAQTIADSLHSVAGQTHPDIEHWVIDGNSADGTQAIVEANSDRIAGFVSEPDCGIYDALNKGLTRASGDVVGFMHADDLYADNGVLARVAAAFADPAIDAIYGDLTYVSREDVSRVIRYWRADPFDRARLSRGWMPPHPTFYVRRGIYERLGGFDTTYRISADYDCVVRFLWVAGIRAAYLPQLIVRMRVGGISNRSFGTVVRKTIEDYEIMRRHGIGGVGCLLQKNVSKVAQFWHR